MWDTEFTRLVGCRIPIQQAGMAPITTPPLAAAVSRAGGLGMIAGTGYPPAFLRDWVRSMTDAMQEPFGVNFIPALQTPEEQRKGVEAVAGSAKVIEFFYSDPDRELVDLVHRSGRLASWQVGSVAEAVAAEKAGCDMVVAQGTEAGGHVRGKVGLLNLLPAVCEATSIPVVAAGGIGTGRAMAGALAAGASAVRVGTRFVAAEESAAHPEYIQQLIGAEASDSVLTSAFHVGWEGAPHRVLRASLEAAADFPGDIVGETRYPDDPETAVPVRRFSTSTPTKWTTGEIRAMPHWAGESVGAVRKVQPAAEIVAEIAGEAERLLRNWGKALDPTGE